MAKKVILVVEDEIALLTVLKSKLEQSGFEVFTAKDGEEGWRIISREKCDLVLLDILMPKMDGIALLRQIRAKLDYHVPVVILTNLGSDEDAQALKDAGADDFLIKAQMTLEEVVERVKKLLP